MEATPRWSRAAPGGGVYACALADEDTAFVTSANLTGLGLDENIELGLLVRGGPTPRRIARYVRGLMAEGVLARA
ncbi:MAG: hypothetical protein ACRDL0_15320 [Thermoleophilaceae bacterium]